MPERAGRVIYWDASAVLSVLFVDLHSGQATATLRRSATHLLSTLAYAEVYAVVAHLEREGNVSSALADAACELVRSGPWRRLSLQPDWASIDALAARWPLRGADLWHLAAATTLSRELPELRLMTFDARLNAAAKALGLTPAG